MQNNIKDPTLSGITTTKNGTRVRIVKSIGGGVLLVEAVTKNGAYITTCLKKDLNLE